MAKRKRKAAVALAKPVAVTPFAYLLLGAQLSDAEVHASLEQELEQERAACHAEMEKVIGEAAAKVPHLSSGIFDGMTCMMEHRDSCMAAIKRAARSVESDPIILPGLRRIHDLLVIQISVAERLREIRSTIAHTDPADYWQQKQMAWERGRGFTRKAGEA